MTIAEEILKLFKVDISRVILSGQLSPDRAWENETSWSPSQSSTYYSVWGYSPLTGFAKLEIVGNDYDDEAVELKDIADVGRFEFFLVKEENKANDIHSATEEWTLYRAPSF